MTDVQGLSGGRAPYQVADAMRVALTHGEYVPGQRLVESELCARFGVSRAVVRESLRLLDGDGLVEVAPHRAARVRAVTVAEAIQIAEVRAAVEGVLARYAALRITPERAAELRDIDQRMRDAVKAFDPLGYSELNEQLHEVIARIADHQAATAIVDRLRLQLVRFNQRLSLLPGRPVETLLAHELVVEAIARGDAPAAEEAMRAHLEEVVISLRTLEQ